MDTDPNLLFGALAVQLGLIQPTQFAEAFQSCTSESHGTLAELLLERGWITTTDRARVDVLVRQQLDGHGTAAEASEAVAGSVGEETACSVSASSSLLSESSDFTPPLPVKDATRKLPTPTPDGDKTPLALAGIAALGEQPERSRYTWTRMHARGGIGQVWVARDVTLEREVAVKALRPEAKHDPGLQARFITEARITGQLAHPGVVPVYELGRRPEDGQLFYAMQFVQGRTLREAVRQYHQHRAEGTAQPLEMRGLLNALVAVCNTVAFAHARGVLHRDLKGLNVILGDFGEVFVLDWGLAKRLAKGDGKQASDDDELPESALGSNDSTHETAQGQVLGTPAYMAPEQAAGRLDAIGPWTDVYGLGAMLYEILTGQAPFIGQDTDDVLRRVQEQEPVPPRHLVHDTPPALEAVCLKALAKAPADRYATASDLAQDLQRWLADEPVLAYREPWSVRWGRWARRHRALVTGGGLSLLTMVVALAVGLVLIGREEARTQAARLRAEDNFRLARRAVDHFYMRISKERLLNEPGLQPLRKDLLREAQDFYQQFVALRGDDPDVQADLGNAYLQLGKITAEIGSTPAALELAQNAIRVARRLTELKPGVASYQHLLGQCYNNQGALYRALGRLEDAEQAFQNAIQVEQELVNKLPGVESYPAYLGLCYNNLGLVRRMRDKPGPAEEALHKAIDLLTPLVDRPQPDDQAASDLAGSWTNLGIVYSDQDQMKQAEAAFKTARQTWEHLVQSRPAVVDYRDNLASSFNNLGSLYQMMQQLAKARSSFGQALAIRQKMVDENPTVTQYREKLAHVYLNLGNLDRDQHQPDEAETAYRKALTIWRRLAQEHHAVASFQHGVGWATYHLGSLMKEEGHLDAALDWYTQAIAAEDRPSSHPQGQDRQILREAYVGRARILTARSRFAESLADWDRALQLTPAADQKNIQTERAGTAKELTHHAATVVAQGHYDALLKEIQSAAGQPRLSGETLYSLARIPALVAGTSRKDGRPTTQEAQQAAKLALTLLDRASSAGFFRTPAQQRLLQTDRALEGLRSRPEFRKLAHPGEAKPTVAPTAAGTATENGYNRGR